MKPAQIAKLLRRIMKEPLSQMQRERVRLGVRVNIHGEPWGGDFGHMAAHVLLRDVEELERLIKELESDA